MSPTTVNLHLVLLSALFNWAENEGIISKNPARGLRVADPVRKKDKRQPFSTEQLNRICNAPLYRGCVDDGAGYASSGKNHPRRGRFWVPLIGLFSGSCSEPGFTGFSISANTISAISCASVSPYSSASPPRPSVIALILAFSALISEMRSMIGAYRSCWTG
jgi:hypothetical protein